jgi:transcription initiation factor TFIIIB Brf1 subunit/transcription initiation factor TFIIB
VPAYPDDQDDPDKKNVVHGVIFYICRRCGWEGKLGELVSTKKFSVKKIGKLMSRIGRMRY